MNIKSLFISDREHQDEYEFTEEESIFQYNFKRYYIRTIHGIVELWARDTKDPMLNFFLGKVINSKIVLSKAFYTHPYDVQKGAGKLCRIYLHNDWRDL